MPNTYDIGDRIRISTDPDGFTDNLTGLSGDPTTVTLILQEPLADGRRGGVETSYTGVQLQHPSTGNYYMDFTPTKWGVWGYRWRGVGGIYAAGEGSFIVRKSTFAAP